MRLRENTALERKWSPPISGASNASAMRTSVLLTIVRFSRHPSSGISAPSGLSENCRPTPSGAHRCFDAPHVLLPAAPCTDSIQTRRLWPATASPPLFDRNRPAAPSRRDTEWRCWRSCRAGTCGGRVFWVRNSIADAPWGGFGSAQLFWDASADTGSARLSGRLCCLRHPSQTRTCGTAALRPAVRSRERWADHSPPPGDRGRRP